MNQKELTLWLEREKQKKELEEELVNIEKPILKKPKEDLGSSQDFSHYNASSDDGKGSIATQSSSSQHTKVTTSVTSSNHTTAGSFENIQANASISAVNSSAKIKADDSSAPVASGNFNSGISPTTSNVPNIDNFAIVKMTGADNFGKSAYTIGKASSNRAISSVDYITRDGAIKNEINGESLTINRADNHIDYMSREEVSRDIKSGVLYNSNGEMLTVSQAKEMMNDITGERRIVFAPDSRLKLTDSEFQKIISKTVNSFSYEFKKDFQYLFAIHRNTDNPHAHIMLTTKQPGGEGIKMFKDELFELKMRFYENTHAMAEEKYDRYEILYKNTSHLNLATQIGKFTGDIPAAEFANQNIYLAQKIAEKYNLQFDEKLMQKDIDNVKKFFEQHKDKYNEFITKAQNRYADTFTKYSKDANALAEKYNLNQPPKDIEGFKNFLKQNQKLFLADKIAIDKNLELTKDDVKKLTAEITKDEQGNLTKEGLKTFRESKEWFTKNEAQVIEWNQENKNRISKELRNRFEQLNDRVDKKFEIPQTRNDGIILNNHYKYDKTIFANETRKALVDIIDSRKNYFKNEYKYKNISMTEYQTNLKRLDSFKENVKAYNDIRESTLQKYSIDTNIFAKEDKSHQVDGIKLSIGSNDKKINELFSKILEKKYLSNNYKKQIQKLSFVANKEGQISLSALENIGFKREDLVADFKIGKIETVAKIINFRNTQTMVDNHNDAIYKSSTRQSLEEWKKENTNNYEFISQQRLVKVQKMFGDTIKRNEMLKGKNKFIDKKIDYMNSTLAKMGNRIAGGGTITKDMAHLMGIDTSRMDTIQQNKNIEFIQKSEINDRLLGVFLDKQKFDYLKNQYSKDNLKLSTLKSIFKKEGFNEQRVNLFETSIRNTTQDILTKPYNLEIKHETVTTALFNQKSSFYDKITGELEKEHGVKIKSAKDFAMHFDKIGTQNKERVVTAQKIEDLVVKNEAFKGRSEYVDAKIDSNNLKLKKLADDIKNSKPILKDVVTNLGFATKNMETKTIAKDVDFVKGTSTNNNLIDSYFQNNNKIQELYKADNLRLSTVAKELEKGGFDKDIAKDFQIATKEVKYEFLIQPFKLEVPQETVSLTLMGSSKMFEKISKQLENEHSVEIKDKQDLLNNYDKIGKPSELRMIFQAQNKDIDGYKATIESLEKIKEKTSHTSQTFKTNKISQQELDKLKAMTKEQLLYTDPANVLNALGIDYKVEKGGARYNFSIRGEDKTPSAFMYLGKGGTWQFKDFGSNQSGTIENVVILATGMNYKDALNYSLEANGLKNLVSEAIDINKSQHQIQLSQEHREKLEALKNTNLKKHSKSDVCSRVVSYREITPKDTTVLNFLEARGIDGIPKDMFIIEGEISGVGANGKEYSYTNIGVGVLTGDMSKPIDLEKVGADIHFLNPKTKADGSIMKTQSFGVKDITIIPGENPTKDYAIFESKMDYAVASGKIDLNETNVIIANGVGNANKVAEVLIGSEVDKVTFFNQNDVPGEKFVLNILEKANLEKFDFVGYEPVKEYKQDINDLVKNQVEIDSRIVQDATPADFKDFVMKNEQAKIEEIQELIQNSELKFAQELVSEVGLDKDIQAVLNKEIELAKVLEATKGNGVVYEIEIENNTKDEQEQEMKTKAALQEKALEAGEEHQVNQVDEKKEQEGENGQIQNLNLKCNFLSFL